VTYCVECSAEWLPYLWLCLVPLVPSRYASSEKRRQGWVLPPQGSSSIRAGFLLQLSGPAYKTPSICPS
jgi:hypothetical protein